MYIKLTKLDNTPIWINAAFVVTVEPARNGMGSIVVPIGDGLDYDVRETPTEVLALLAGEPSPTVVPVPPPPGLTKTPNDVSPEAPEEPLPGKSARKVRGRKAKAVSAEGEEKRPASRAKRGKSKAETSEPGEETVAPPPVEALQAAPAETETPGAAVEQVPDIFASATVDDFTEDQISRLRKMAPKSIRKLTNTLTSQFRVMDADRVIRILQDRGCLSLDGDHITWN